MKPQKGLKANLFFWGILLLCYGVLLIFVTSTSLPSHIHYPSETCKVIAKTIFKLTHIPLFAILTLLLVKVFNAKTNFVTHRLLKYYSLIFGISMFFAVLTEALQFIGPRNANIFDLFLDGLGSFIVLIIIYLRSSEDRV